MQIKPQPGSHAHIEVPSATPAPKVEKTNAAPQRPSQPSASRNDEVHISVAGRELAARSSSSTSELSPERIAQLRQRVLDGAYNSLAVVDKVARRIIGSGDLG
jgi:negative regulator of flagellin synthesis FlgM